MPQLPWLQPLICDDTGRDDLSGAYRLKRADVWRPLQHGHELIEGPGFLPPREVSVEVFSGLPGLHDHDGRPVLAQIGGQALVLIADPPKPARR